MPGRQYNASTGYRYGFNGKEKDKELVQYDYGFRIYDPRLVRFKSVDPLFKRFPWYTPYQFAGNKPIWAIDLDGLEEKKVTHHLAKYDDGSFYTKKTDVDIAQNTYISVTDRNTGKEIKQLAKTTVNYEYEGDIFEGEVLYEDRMTKGLKPSAGYNYTDDNGTGSTSMRQKNNDDGDYAGGNPFKWWDITKRDYNAPDNAITKQDLQILDVVGDILEKRLKIKVPTIAPSPILGNKAPKYENPGHHDPNNPNFNKTKSVLPSNHKELFDGSTLGKDGNRWKVEGTGKKKVFHRFQDDGNGNWHWNGSTNSKKADGTNNSISPNNVPIEIKRL